MHPFLIKKHILADGLIQFDLVVLNVYLQITKQHSFSAIQNLADVRYTTSDQHQQESGTRLVKDQEDDKKMYDFLEDRHPFPDTTALRNIVTGVEIDEHVDVYKTHEIGQKII